MTEGLCGEGPADSPHRQPTHVWGICKEEHPKLGFNLQKHQFFHHGEKQNGLTFIFGLAFCCELAVRVAGGPPSAPRALGLPRAHPALGFLRPLVGSSFQALELKDPFLLTFSFSSAISRGPGRIVQISAHQHPLREECSVLP